jgi:hypothetical protein
MTSIVMHFFGLYLRDKYCKIKYQNTIRTEFQRVKGK